MEENKNTKRTEETEAKQPEEMVDPWDLILFGPPRRQEAPEVEAVEEKQQPKKPSKKQKK